MFFFSISSGAARLFEHNLTNRFARASFAARSYTPNGKKNGGFRGMSENEHSIHIVFVSVHMADKKYLPGICVTGGKKKKAKK